MGTDLRQFESIFKLCNATGMSLAWRDMPTTTDTLQSPDLDHKGHKNLQLSTVLIVMLVV